MDFCCEHNPKFFNLVSDAELFIREANERKDNNYIYYYIILFEFVLNKASRLKSIKVLNLEYYLNMLTSYVIRKKNKIKPDRLDFEDLRLQRGEALREVNIFHFYKYLILIMMKLLIL